MAIFFVFRFFAGEKIDDAAAYSSENSAEGDEKEVDEPCFAVVKNQFFGILRQVGDGDLRTDFHVIEIAAAVIVGYGVGGALCVGEAEYGGGDPGASAAAAQGVFPDYPADGGFCAFSCCAYVELIGRAEQPAEQDDDAEKQEWSTEPPLRSLVEA